MIPASLQEKSQVSAKPVDEDGSNEWATFAGARDSQASVGSFHERKAFDTDMRRFNQMPPGMEIANQQFAEFHEAPLVLSGETDPSKGIDPESLHCGYSKRTMHGTDDQATGKHQDLFYGDAGGFVERNNYLDRN